MPNKTSFVIGSQVPEFVRTDYPKFVEFLKAYYEFLNQYNVDFERTRDLDTISNTLVAQLRQEFLNKFPYALVDDKKLIQIIRQLYRTKGTINGVELMFRLMFNESITIRQPNKNILRASDGKWEQESAITTFDVFGAVPQTEFIQLKIENDFGVFYIDVNRVENIDSENVKFIFNTSDSVPIVTNQIVDILDNNGIIVYRGQVVKTPSYLRIVNPGKNWKRGQLIFIPGSEANSIARVNKISALGEIEDIEVVEYGYSHAENETVVVSPYPNKPLNATSDLDIQITGYNPSTETYIYDYTLTLNDYTDGVGEELIGISDAAGFNSYFLDDYVIGGYSGSVVLYEKVTNAFTPQVSIVDPSLTIEEWLLSRATLSFVFDNVVNFKGKFVDNSGQLSNPEIRLQDNYFYQLFSYVIETTLNYNEYSGSLNQVHPAGLKFFGELVKTALITNDQITADNIFNTNTVYRINILNVFDTIVKDFVKERSDIVNVTDEITDKAINTIKSDSVNFTDTGSSLYIDYYSLDTESYFAENYTPEDATLTIG